MSGDFPFASRIQEFSNVFPFISEFLGVSAFRTIPRVSRGWNRHLGSLLKTQIATRTLQDRWELQAKNAFERKLPDEFKSGDGGRSVNSNRCIIYHAEMDRLLSAEDLLPGDWVVIRNRSGTQWTATADWSQKYVNVLVRETVIHFYFYLGFHVKEKDALQSEAESLMVTRLWSEAVKSKLWTSVAKDMEYVERPPHFHRYVLMPPFHF